MNAACEFWHIVVNGWRAVAASILRRLLSYIMQLIMQEDSAPRLFIFVSLAFEFW